MIEVDGGYHQLKEQKERDMLKDSILKKSGIPILRLPTTVGNIYDKITDFILDIVE